MLALVLAFLPVPINAQRTIAPSMYTNDYRIPTNGHVKTEGLVRFTKGSFHFETLEVPKNSRLEIGAVERFIVDHLIVSGGGEAGGTTDPGVVIGPGLPGTTDFVNARGTILDEPRSYYKTPARRYTCELVSGVRQTYRVEAARRTIGDDYTKANGYEWVMQDRNGLLQYATEATVTYELVEGINYMVVSLLFNNPMASGSGRVWVEKPANFQRNIFINKFTTYDAPIAGMSAYGTDGLYIGIIQASNRGRDAAVTIEFSRNAYVGTVIGSGNHFGYGGTYQHSPALIFLFSTRNAYVGPGNAVVALQANGAPVMQNLGLTPFKVINAGMVEAKPN